MRRLILYGVIIFQIAMIISLIRGIQLSTRSVSRISLMEEMKLRLIEESKKLQLEGENIKSPYYLEKVAREELHLSKLGETVVIIPDDRKDGELFKNEVAFDEKGQIMPNWMKWWEVLSGRI